MKINPFGYTQEEVEMIEQEISKEEENKRNYT